MILEIKMNNKEYQVIIERGILNKSSSYLSANSLDIKNRKTLILTDDGIPVQYVDILKENIANQNNDNVFVYTIKQGEESKSFANYSSIIDYLIDNEFTRTDCVIALGGGVVGDLAGFVSATYMRGIAFYNIPTTLLAQVDSSIGGKTAIDKKGYKNLVGAFYPPEKVLIDPNVLSTLDKRQFMAGLVEALKMGLTSDKELYELIKNSNNIYKDIDTVIEKALLVKKDVVEKDPHEKHLRKILNFGHTIGHAIESSGKFNLLHGECVGIGLLYMTPVNLQNEIKDVLVKYNLPTKESIANTITNDDLFKYISLDKKRSNKDITIVEVKEPGTFEINKISLDEIKNYL